MDDTPATFAMCDATDALEGAARAIFDLMPHNGTIGSLRPAWDQAENGLQRDEALRYARTAAPFFSSTPSPQADMRVTDKMVDEALESYDFGTFKSATNVGRKKMRTALEAALSVADPSTQPNVEWPTEAICRLIHDHAGTKSPDEPLHHPAQKSWEEPTLVRWQQWEPLSEELCELLRGQSASKTLPDMHHKFIPHKEYPWFCASCGYAPHEPLMHDQTTNPSPQPNVVPNTVPVEREVLRDIAQLLSGSMFTFISTEDHARARGSELYALLAISAPEVSDNGR